MFKNVSFSPWDPAECCIHFVNSLRGEMGHKMSYFGSGFWSEVFSFGLTHNIEYYWSVKKAIILADLNDICSRNIHWIRWHPNDAWCHPFPGGMTHMSKVVIRAPVDAEQHEMYSGTQRNPGEIRVPEWCRLTDGQHQVTQQHACKIQMSKIACL